MIATFVTKLKEPPPEPTHGGFQDSVAYDHKFRQFLVSKTILAVYCSSNSL